MVKGQAIIFQIAEVHKSSLEKSVIFEGLSKPTSNTRLCNLGNAFAGKYCQLWGNFESHLVNACTSIVQSAKGSILIRFCDKIKALVK